VPARDTRLALWRGLTLKGNLALEAGRDVQARRLHEEALAAADDLFDAAALANDPEAARVGPLLFGISCNNVVELARRQGDTQTEGIYLYRAVERLIGVATSAQAPLALRSRCLLHLRVASEALYRYFERHGMWDAAAAYSGRANAAMFDVQRLTAASALAARSSAAAARPAAGGPVPARQGSINILCVPAEAPLQHSSEHDEVEQIEARKAGEAAVHPGRR
jgi:hypothetical protein